MPMMPTSKTTAEGHVKRFKATRRRAQLSCDRCRLIKRKCNREKPCARCVRDAEECSFERAERTKAPLWKRPTPHKVPSEAPADQAQSIKDQDSPAGSAASSHASSSRVSSNITSSSRTSYSVHGHPDDFNAESLRRLVSHPVFLERVMDIYFREIEWTCDLLDGTRIHRLTSEYHDPANTFPAMWAEVQSLAFGIISLVAQQCPTDIESVLVGLDNEARQGFFTADSVAQAAHQAASVALTSLGTTTEPRFWSAEVLATTFFLRNFEKNEGRMQSLIDNGATDVARFLRTDYARQGTSGEIRTWQEEHDLLAYRVFWAYFHNDRVGSMYAGSHYLIQPQYLDVCLRDPMGHITAQDLCNLEGGQRPCSCSHRASSLEHTAVARGPTLTAYKGANSRLSAIIGRYFDRLGACRNSSFQWPYDAERMAMDLDADLLCFEANVAQLPPALFRMGQKEILSLCVASLRGDVAKRLCDAFAANLLSREKALLPEAVDWMLQRRSLDTAKALILRAVDVPRTSSLGARVSWVFFPKFVHRHTMDLLVAAKRWTARQHDAEGTAYLLDCLRHAVMGRNFLVLLTRRSELPAAKRLVDEVCAHTLEVLGTWLDGGEREEEDEQRQRRLTVRNADIIVNDAALMADIEARLPAPLPPNLENLDFNLDETLASLFADLPALEQLFGFGAVAPVQ